MKKKKLDKNKIINSLLLIFLGLILFLSLISFRPDKPMSENWFGVFGARLAGPLFEQTFGYGALGFPIMIFYLVFAMYKKQKPLLIFENLVKILITGFWLGILLGAPEVLANWGDPSDAFPSGQFCYMFLGFLKSYTGNFGSGFILLALFVLFFLWLIRDVAVVIRFFALFKPLGRGIAAGFNSVLKIFKKGLSLFSFRRALPVKDDFIIETEENVTIEVVPDTETIEVSRVIESEIPGENEADSEVNSAEIHDGPQNLIEETTENMVDADTTVAPIEEIIRSRFQHDESIEIFPPVEDDVVEEENSEEDDTLLLRRVKEQKQKATGEKQTLTGIEVEKQHIDREVQIKKFIEHQLKKYEFPPLDLLDFNPDNEKKVTREELEFNAKLLVETLSHFNVEARMVKVMEGPVVTQYQLKPAQGVKISKIVTLQDDLALALRARGIRIIAPIPGKAAVGVEIPNRNRSIVYLKSVLRSEKFVNFKAKLPIVLGRQINGEIYCDDLAEMPHLLVAGATGTGKSVGLNVLLSSLLYRIPPTDVKFILIDPKRLEFSFYEDLKNHYLAYCPELDEYVITEPDNAVLMLQSLIVEMEKRYQMLKELAVRNLAEYNEKIKSDLDPDEDYTYEHKHLPYLVVVIDELADLMLSSAKEVEEPIARLTQKARAAGIHLIVATQRPSVNVITGTIKANFPVRVAYQVPQKIDSKVILDQLGADQLIGKGDMLFKSPSFPKPIRIQTPLIETHEVERIVKHIKKQPHFPPYELQLPAKEETRGGSDHLSGYIDPLFEEAKKIVIIHQVGSASLLQRKLRIGYARAASILDQLEEAHIVGPSMGSKGREVYIDKLDD